MASRLVTTNADSGTGSLRTVLNNAADGDVIIFDTFIFEPNVETTILLNNAITSTATKNLTFDAIHDENGAEISGATWTDGGFLKTRVVIDGAGSYRCFNATSASGYNFNFKGITFSNGAVGTNTYGAGVQFRSTESTNTVDSCVFKNCVSGGGGGGVGSINPTTSVIFNNCLFDTCNADNGGASYNTSSSAFTFNNCTFKNNTATTNGNAIYLTTYGKVTINNCVFIPAENNTTATMYNNATQGTASLTIVGYNAVDIITCATGTTITFSGVDSVLAVTNTATIGSATFTSAENSTGYAAFPENTDISAATFTGVKVATYSTSTPTISASIGETRTATVTISNAEAGYIAEVVYADGVVDDITIDDGSAVIAVDKAFKIRVFNGAFYESATVARTYYLKTYDADGDFATAADWTLDAQKTLTCNAAPTISGGVFYCTEPAEG